MLMVADINFVVCLLPAPEHNAEQNSREVTRLPV